MVKRIISENLGDEFNRIREADFQRDSLQEKKRDQVRKLNRMKMANVYMGESGYGGAADIVGIAPEYFVPQLENSSLELARYRQEIISWCDYYYQTNELIGTAVDIHATLSVADFAISCKDRVIQQEYEDMLEDLNYSELLSDIAHEYFRVGNVFPMGNYDVDNKTWTDFVLYPTLTIELKNSLLTKEPRIYLVPNESLKQVVNDPDIKDELGQLPEEMVSKLRQGLPLLLDNNRVSHISTKAIAGTLWGVPPIYRCFKTLVYGDKLFRAQEAIAEGHITPLKIISLATPDGLPVTPDEEDHFRQQLVDASFDPNFTILTAGIVKDSYIGSSGRVLPLNSEMDNLERKITSGMKINKALLHGEGPTYANAQVYQTTMNTYYLHFRNKLRNWLLRKVFTPIAKARGYYRNTDVDESTNLNITMGGKRLILPDIIWSGMSSLDQQTTMLVKDLWMSKKLSTDSYFKMVLPNIDPEEEAVKVLREAEQTVTIKQVAPELGQELSKPQDAVGAPKQDEEETPSTTPKKPTPPDAKGKGVVKHNRQEYLNELRSKYDNATVADITTWLNTRRTGDEEKDAQ